MKPDWNDAPEWARWLAMDPDGSWWWFDAKPEIANRPWGREWQHVSNTRAARALGRITLPDIEDTLEARP